jgi:Flp pilus assembly protein TadG
MKNGLHMFKNQSGFTLVLLGLTIVVLLGFAALAVDIGYLYAARNELQNAADAGALAGARELGKIYLDKVSYTQNTAKGGDTYSVFLAAKEVAGKNAAAGESVSLNVFALKENADGKMVIDPDNVSTDGADVILGNWDWSATSGDKLQTTGVTQPDAVRVYAKRQKNVNPVTLFFANVLGIADAGVSAVATAVLSGLSEVKEGELDLPIGISDTWFKMGWECGKNILFYPTNDSCAGWTNWTDVNSNKVSDPDLKNTIFPGLINGTLQSPDAKINETAWWFGGGNLSKETWEKLDELFQAKKGADGKWTVNVAIYHFSGDSELSCGNPNPTKNTPLTIVGFATLTMEEVVVPPSTPGGAPQKSLQGAVDCNVVVDARGGGGYYGTMGKIPGLVQ